ncbi:MAG: ABC transporter permease [Chitinispirillaceae bacterium]|nr:ABC transporter permease [Chitinispirillaceae bacterium]
MAAVGDTAQCGCRVRKITRSSPRIRPFDFPDLWRWRYLIYLFVKRDFAVYFQQTVLGPLWYLLQPLASTTVLSIIFGRIARLPTDSIPPFLFYMLGGVVWSYFADCFTRTSHALSASAREFGNAAFPRLTVPVAAVLSALIQFGVQFALFLLIYLWYMRGDVHVSVNLLLLLPAMAQLALVGMGGGMLVAALTSKYRDLSHLVGFCIQLLYFCTPLVYPLSMVQEPWRRLYGYNPLTSVVEIFRRAFFSAASLTADEYYIGWIVTAAIFAGGLVVFNIVEKKCIDTV